jgi:hypothetical protein
MTLKNTVLFTSVLVTQLSYPMFEALIIATHQPKKKDLTKIDVNEIQTVSKAHTNNGLEEEYVANLYNNDIVFAYKEKDGQACCIRKTFDDQNSAYANCSTVILDNKYYDMLKDLWEKNQV